MSMQYKSGGLGGGVIGGGRRIVAALALGSLMLAASGCMNDQIAATNKLVQQQQEQLEQQQQELEALKINQQNQQYTPGVATTSPGGCDRQVEEVASQRGGDKFASGDYAKALGYYRDAMMACPNDDRATVNVARTYEALGNNVQAIKYYRQAADSSGPTVSDASEEAKSALLRLQASRLP
jgi:tetratricopeptide (TPR) repeat protein